ncbi:MAG: RHS domain-containing protein, partial [Flavobacteriales bacterium]|nr:RHS domain-containing protein [Flavobacteriales bacterium]
PLHEWKEHALTGQKLSDLKVGENGLVTWLFDIDGFIPAGKIKGGKEYSIVTDHLGTPSQMYREDGLLFWECELDSYGKARIEKGELGSCPFRYQGQYEDIETGLYYNRFRYYDAKDGIYLSQDPIGLEGGIRLFSYVHDPNSWIDALGLASRTYITYRGRDRKTGKPYVGFASGPGHLTGEQVLSRRYSGDFARFSRKPTIIYQGSSRPIARGLEHRTFQRNGGLSGTANRQNPISPSNPNRTRYLRAADRHQRR